MSDRQANAFRARQRRDRKRALIISVTFGLALTVGAVLASRFSIEVLSQSSDSQPYTGALRGDIVLESDRGKRCRSFGNMTGRVTDHACPQKVDNVVPVPHGTTGRLDAIAKSFLNR
jgi:hypothetical protein